MKTYLLPWELLYAHPAWGETYCRRDARAGGRFVFVWQVVGEKEKWGGDYVKGEIVGACETKEEAMRLTDQLLTQIGFILISEREALLV